MQPNFDPNQIPSAFAPVDPNGAPGDKNGQNPSSAFLPAGGHAAQMASMFPLGYNPAALMMLPQFFQQMNGMQNPNAFLHLPPQAPLVSLKREAEHRDSGNESYSGSGSLSPTSTRSSRSNSNQFNFTISSLIPTDAPAPQEPPAPVEQPKPVISKASSTPPPAHFPPVSQMLNTPQQMQHHPNLAQFHQQMHPAWHQAPHPFLQSPLMQSPLAMNQHGFAQMNAAHLYGNLPQGSELCVVCGDKASGHHYGVVSCEGCKGFFRRSVQKNQKYECTKDGKCQVARHTRNRCQCCRYEKCLKEGMTRESVRQDKNKSRKTREESDCRQLDEMRRMQSLQENVIKAYQNTLGDHLPADRSQTRSLIKLFLAGINEFVDIPDGVKTKQIESRFDAFISLRRLVMSDPCTGLLPPKTESVESSSGSSRSAHDRLQAFVTDGTIRFEEMAILSTWCLLHSYGDETLARHQSDLTTCLKAQLATHDKQGALNVLMLNAGELCD